MEIMSDFNLAFEMRRNARTLGFHRAYQGGHSLNHMDLNHMGNHECYHHDERHT